MKKIYIVSVIVLSSLNLSVAHAEPLPIGTVLSIESGNANLAGNSEADVCTTGSCFGVEISLGTWIWNNIAAGTDGGLVVGKNQVSGGQELGGESSTNSTPGEMTDAWQHFGAYGTFFTPLGSENKFDTDACINESCIEKTSLPSFDIAWNGAVLSIGESALSSIDWKTFPDGSYSLEYVTQVTDQNCPFCSPYIVNVILRGQIQPGIFIPPTAGPVTIDNIAGLSTEWIPDVSGAVGYQKVCAIETQPANGVVSIDAGCTFGTYQSNAGFVGVDNFTYSVTSGFVSDTASVTANVSDAVCESYPIQMATTTGGGQSQTINAELTTTFVGRLTTQQGLTSGAKNKITVCPGTNVSFESLASVGKASCSINGAATGSSGMLFSGDKLICTNKPDGGDVDRFTVKNGL